MSTDAARAPFGRWNRVPRAVTRNLSPHARRSPPSHTPTAATSTTNRIWYFIGNLPGAGGNSPSGGQRLPHIVTRLLRNAHAPDESGEPRVVPYAIPRAIHFEPHQPCGSLGKSG